MYDTLNQTMTISLYYDFMGERKSQVVSLTILRDYNIMWHFMEQEGRDLNAFNQSRTLTENEYSALLQELSVLFEQRNIPLWILEE